MLHALVWCALPSESFGDHIEQRRPCSLFLKTCCLITLLQHSATRYCQLFLAMNRDDVNGFENIEDINNGGKKCLLQLYLCALYIQFVGCPLIIVEILCPLDFMNFLERLQ